MTSPLKALMVFARGLGMAWRRRWNVARLVVAASLLYALAADNPARLARLQLAHLAPMNYVGRVRDLRAQKRYAEALLVADAGLEHLSGPDRQALERERDAVARERDSIVRRLLEFGLGAAIGDGDSVEALLGAVTADMLVVGDIRDLFIQGGHLLVDGEADKAVLALSTLGIATTLAPEFDLPVALLKVAKKMGAVSKRLLRALVRIARYAKRTGDTKQLRRVLVNVRTLADKATPAGAIRILRHLDSPEDIELAARFARRRGGAFALHVAGPEGVKVLRAGSAAAENALLAAAKKGDRGMAWLRMGMARSFRPHPLIGVAKVIWKGTGLRFVQRVVAECLDPYGSLLMLALAGWVLMELSTLARGLARRPVPAPSPEAAT